MPLPLIEASLTELVIDGAEEIIKLLWHHYAGESSSNDAKKAMAAIRDGSIDAFAKAVEDGVAAELARRDMAAALAQAALGTRHVLDAFTPKGKIPPLNLPIEQVAELDEPAPIASDDVPTKPGG